MRTRLIPLIPFVVAAVLVACDEAKRLPPAATQSVVPPASQPEAVGQPPDALPSDDQPATKPWVMPSAEELAVKAAAIDDLLLARRKTAGEPDMAVFLDMNKEEVAALMAMLPQHAPPLKDPRKMSVHQGSLDNIYNPRRVFDSETGFPAMMLTVHSVSITQAPVPRQGREATVRVATDLGGQFGFVDSEYRLSDRSGRWEVTGRQMRMAT